MIYKKFDDNSPRFIKKLQIIKLHFYKNERSSQSLIFIFYNIFDTK